MKSPTIEMNDIQRLIENGYLSIKNEEKDENRSKEMAILIWFIFLLGLLPTLLTFYLFVIDIISNDIARAFKVSVFMIFFMGMELLFFLMGWKYYLYSKNKLYVFWKYFIKGKLDLVFVGTREFNGKEYVTNEFMSKKLNYLQPTFLISINIRKDIHKKAVKLNQKLHSMAVDKDGNRKFVFNDGAIRDADTDVIILAAFIKTLYMLYAKDIDKLYADIEGEKS